MAGIDLFNTIMDYMGSRGTTPVVQTANIPMPVRSKAGAITKNPHATIEQVMQELAAMTVDELNAQVSADVRTGRNPQFVSAFRKVSPTADYASAMSSVISDTTPRATGTSSLASDMAVLMDLASRPQVKGR